MSGDKNNGVDKLSEGAALLSYIKRNRIHQESLAEKLGFTNRHSLRYYFDRDVLTYEFKQRLKDVGIDIFNVGEDTSPLPRTHADMFQLMRETIDALKGENDVLKKYIKKLEDTV